MQINPPVYILCSHDIPMYDTEIYLQVKYPIENIYEAIEKAYLSKASILHIDTTLNIYDIGDEGYNIFLCSSKALKESHHSIGRHEAIDIIKAFLSTK